MKKVLTDYNRLAADTNAPAPSVGGGPAGSEASGVEADAAADAAAADAADAADQEGRQDLLVAQRAQRAQAARELEEAHEREARALRLAQQHSEEIERLRRQLLLSSKESEIAHRSFQTSLMEAEASKARQREQFERVIDVLHAEYAEDERKRAAELVESESLAGAQGSARPAARGKAGRPSARGALGGRERSVPEREAGADSSETSEVLLLRRHLTQERAQLRTVISAREAQIRTLEGRIAEFEQEVALVARQAKAELTASLRTRELEVKRLKKKLSDQSRQHEHEKKALWADVERLQEHGESLEQLAQVAIMGQSAPVSASQAQWEEAHTLVQPSPAQFPPSSLLADDRSPVMAEPHAGSHAAFPDPTLLATPNASSTLRPSRRAPRPPPGAATSGSGWAPSPMRNTRARIDENGRVVIETIGSNGDSSAPVPITNYIRNNAPASNYGR